MWLVIDNLTHTVRAIESKEPPIGAYDAAVYEIKEWLGDTPKLPDLDPDTGVETPGDPDPTLTDPDYIDFQQEQVAFENLAAADWGAISNAEKDTLMRDAMPYIVRRLL